MNILIVYNKLFPLAGADLQSVTINTCFWFHTLGLGFENNQFS